MKKNIISIITLIALLTIISCDTEKVSLNNVIVPFQSFPLVDSIVFSPVYEYIHGVPGNIQIVDSMLIILNRNKDSEYFLNNLNLTNNEVSEGYLRRGRGPYEALGAWQTGIHDNKLWIYDVTTRKVLTIPLDQVLSDSGEKEITEFKLAKQYIRMDFLDSCTILAVGSAETYTKMSVVEINSGKEISEIGEFEMIPEKVPFAALKDAFTSYINIKPSGGKVALPYRYTDVIEIYDLNDHTCKAVWGPEGFDVQYEAARNSFGFFMAKTKETRKAFVTGGAVTDSLIYLIYSGHYREDENWSNGKYIFVFDWDGNPVKKIVLDRYINVFDVADDNSSIYAYDNNTGFIIKSDLIKQLE